MILNLAGKEIKRTPASGEKPGVGTRFYINGHMFRIVYVKHGKDGSYQRFTAELTQPPLAEELPSQ